MTKEKKRKKRNKTPQNHQAQSSLSCRRLFRAHWPCKLATVYPKGHYWFRVGVDVVEVEGMKRGGESCSGKDEGGGGGGGGERSRGDFTATPPLLSLSLFLTVAHPLGTNYFPPLPSTAVTIKDGGNNFHQENTVQTLANYGCNQIHSNVCLATMEFTIGWLSDLGKICTDWHLNLTTWHTLWRPSFHMWRPTFKDTPLPNVTSPDTVKWSSSIKSGMVSKRFKKSFTYW